MIILSPDKLRIFATRMTCRGWKRNYIRLASALQEFKLNTANFILKDLLKEALMRLWKLLGLNKRLLTSATEESCIARSSIAVSSPLLLRAMSLLLEKSEILTVVTPKNLQNLKNFFLFTNQGSFSGKMKTAAPFSWGHRGPVEFLFARAEWTDRNSIEIMIHAMIVYWNPLLNFCL